MKIILRHRIKYTDKLELTLEEFKQKFKKELNSAIQIYKKEKEQNALMQPWRLSLLNESHESNFYQNLRWNFNNKVRTAYYIDKIE